MAFPQNRNCILASLQEMFHLFFQIVLRAIVAAAKEMHSERSTGRPFELDLAAIHTAHFRIRQRLTWLSQLLHYKTDILPELCSSFSWDENEMVRPIRMFFFFNLFHVYSHQTTSQISGSLCHDNVTFSGNGKEEYTDKN